MEDSFWTKVVLVLSVSLALGIWFVTNHFWFPIEKRNVLFNGAPVYNDYVPVKSLKGDIYLRNQDNQTQYLISIKNQEVSIIKDEGGFIDLGILYTSESLTDTDNPRNKTKLNDSNLLITDEFIKFTSEVNEHWLVIR